MALREYLREAERKGLGEESVCVCIGHIGVRNTLDLVMPARFSVAFQRTYPRPRRAVQPDDSS